jgi:hypothetical protein
MRSVCQVFSLKGKTVIEDIIKRFGGTVRDANTFWPDGVLDQREVIVELPWSAAFITFQAEINVILDQNNPIQYISDEIGHKRFFLYYAE